MFSPLRAISWWLLSDVTFVLTAHFFAHAKKTAFFTKIYLIIVRNACFFSEIDKQNQIIYNENCRRVSNWRVSVLDKLRRILFVWGFSGNEKSCFNRHNLRWKVRFGELRASRKTMLFSVVHNNTDQEIPFSFCRLGKRISWSVPLPPEGLWADTLQQAQLIFCRHLTDCKIDFAVRAGRFSCVLY